MMHGYYGDGPWMWGPGHLLWMVVIGLVLVVPVWRICQKAGYPGWLGLLSIVPLLNLGLLYFLAFSKWPREAADMLDKRG